MRGLLKEIFTSSALLATAMAAHAATAPVGTLQCEGELTANLSYYDISQATAGSSQAAGVPVALHTSLSNFVHFFELAATGKHLAQCTLTATAANGFSIQYRFVEVVVTSANAIGRSGRTPKDEPGGLVIAQLIASKVQVSSTNGQDDGGSDGGWDLTGNKSAL